MRCPLAGTLACREPVRLPSQAGPDGKIFTFQGRRSARERKRGGGVDGSASERENRESAGKLLEPEETQ